MADEQKEQAASIVTGKAPEKTVKALPEAVIAAIVDKHLGHRIESIKISAKVSPTKKDETREFDALYALDALGMGLLMGGKIEAASEAEKDDTVEVAKAKAKLGACDHFNYGRILNVRQNVRTALESDLEGPEKAIAKQVKALVDGGTFDTNQEALEFVVGRMKAQNKLAADYVFNGELK
jgi:hypothetical protein